MGHNAFLFWMLASPVIAGGVAWLLERLEAVTIREWIAEPSSNSLRPPR